MVFMMGTQRIGVSEEEGRWVIGTWNLGLKSKSETEQRQILSLNSEVNRQAMLSVKERAVY